MPSARFTTAALAQASDERPVHLVTIEHANFDGPIRLCDGGADTVSNGATFIATPMRVAPPGDAPDAGGRRGRIAIDNTTPEIIAQLRLANSRPLAKIEIVLAATPDVIEHAWGGLRVTGQRAGAQAIELELAERDDAGEVFPYQGFTPHRFPALFD